jgi:hypothetical protein
MQTRMQITESEPEEFARVFVFANTPASLVNGMVRCSGMSKLRKSDIADLSAEFDELTACSDRNKRIVGLAYAVLCALAEHADASKESVNVARLLWGPPIWGRATRTYISTDITNFKVPELPEQKLSKHESPSVPLIVGQMASLRNKGTR